MEDKHIIKYGIGFCIVIALFHLFTGGIVRYNTVSGIYHKPWCEWSRKCVDNCVWKLKYDAERHGRKCKVCGG